MHALLNDAPVTRIVQQTGRVTSKQLDAVDQLLLLLPERVPATAWNSLPQGARLKAALRKRERDAAPSPLSRLANKRQTLALVGEAA